MYYSNEEIKPPVFDELEITFYPTRGVSHLLNDAKIGEIDGVEFFHHWHQTGTSTLKFLAPKLTEILTTIKAYAQNDVPEWNRKSVKNSSTRAINALEKCVAERWANRKNYYARTLDDLRRIANGDCKFEYDTTLEKGQYGYKVVVTEDGQNTYRGNTVAVVPLIVDDKPVIKWAVDDDGFYLSMGGGNRREKQALYETLEEAIAEAYVRTIPIIAKLLEAQDKRQEDAIVKLAELEADAFIKVQEIA